MTLAVRLARTPADRRACYDLRIAVFVHEQGVPIIEELDEHDESDAVHFMGLADGDLVATARAIPRGDDLKIQRVAVGEAHRGRGYGFDLMGAILDHLETHHPNKGVVLDSQTHAAGFYTRLGFIAEGDEFDDAGLPHIRMRLCA